MLFMKNQHSKTKITKQTLNQDLKYFCSDTLQKNLFLRIKKAFLELKSKIYKFGTSRISVMIIPHSSSKAVNLHISNYVVVFAALICSMTVIATTYIVATGQINSRHKLRLIVENDALEEKFYSVSQTVDSLTDYFTQFRIDIGSVIAPPNDADAEYLNSVQVSDASSGVPQEIVKLRQLERELEVTKQKIFNVGNFMKENKRILREIPSLYPVASRARITSRFGMRKNPFDQRGVETHDGLDMATFPGTPVYASADGVVKKAGVQGGYGNLIELEHQYGFKTRYGHLRGFAAQIYPGARVKQGQIIGYVGATGRVTGYHLHYEVWIGNNRTDPEPFAMMLR
ncbi:MAG: M23 family metallopeptidase [Brevinemataceae bacterium]